MKSPGECPDPDEFLTQVANSPRQIVATSNYPQLFTPPTPQLFTQEDDFFGSFSSSLGNDQSLGNQAVAVTSSAAPQLVALDHNYSQTVRQPRNKVVTSQCNVSSPQQHQVSPQQRKRSRPSAELRTDVSQLIRITSSPPPQFEFSEFPESTTSSYDSFDQSLDQGSSPSQVSYLQQALQQPCTSSYQAVSSHQEPQKKRRRNNEACRESRKKKKNERQENEAKVQTLTEDNDKLRVQIEQLERERDRVKKELMDTITRGFCS